MFNINDLPLRPSATNFLLLFTTLAAAHTIMYLLVSRYRGAINPSFTKIMGILTPFLRLAAAWACDAFSTALKLLARKKIVSELQGSQPEGPTRATQLEPPLVTDPSHTPRRALTWPSMPLPSVSLPTIFFPTISLPPMPVLSIPPFSRGRSCNGTEEYELPVANVQRSTLSEVSQS